MSLYVKKDENKDKTKAFMDKMSKKQVDADFLNTIEEEEKRPEKKKPLEGKKYPFNRQV